MQRVSELLIGGISHEIPNRSVIAHAVFVPTRLMRTWLASLTDLELGIVLTLLGDTWLIGQLAAPCPIHRLAIYWESLARVVSAAEIETAVSSLVRRQTLRVVTGSGQESGRQEPPLYCINRDWRGPPESASEIPRDHS